MAHTLEQSHEIAQRVRDTFKKHDAFYEVGTSLGLITVEINWGDWKHDHGWVNYILVSELNLKLVDEKVTEEDGSDTYSSIHYYE